MRKQQSHWLLLTYYHPCFDFSESVRANTHSQINIHESNSSLILGFILSLLAEFIFVIFMLFLSLLLLLLLLLLL